MKIKALLILILCALLLISCTDDMPSEYPAEEKPETNVSEVATPSEITDEKEEPLPETPVAPDNEPEEAPPEEEAPTTDVSEVTEPLPVDPPTLEEPEEAQPTDPVEPTKPIEPVEPTKPVEPVEPVESIEPVEPTQPTQPVEPTQPETQIPEPIIPNVPEVTPIEEVAVETFTMPSKKNFDNETFGGAKTVAEQRREIADGMALAMSTEVTYKEIPEYAPSISKYSHIKAITYDAFEYQGHKTKVFAYIGFPEGASEDSPVPAVVLVHGGGGHPYMEWVRLWNERGYAAIAMETTGYFPISRDAGANESSAENAKFTYQMTSVFAEEGYGLAPNRSYPTQYTEVNEQWAYHGLSQVILAGNILRQDSRVDSSNIGITGISWGGTMVAQVIGYDNRFSFAIPVYGTAYLGDEMRSFSNFDNDYVDALWAAERNLDNAKMPILWYAYNDDNNFGVNSYVNSYKHTQGFNDKNTLVMLGNWSHSHGSVWNKMHSFYFADWATWGKTGFVTFKTQPKGREVNCRINIPDNVTGLAAYVYYIEEPMSYSNHDKFNRGTSYVYLDQKWSVAKSLLKIDKTTGTITGTIPENVMGYYIDILFKIDGSDKSNSSSVFVDLSK